MLSEFRKGIDWDKETVAKLSGLCDLSESQVYKWNWDQRKKFGSQMEIEERTEVSRDEFGGYCCKRWGKLEELCSDESIYGLLNLNIEDKARAIVLKDQEKKEVQKIEIQKKVQVFTPTPQQARP